MIYLLHYNRRSGSVKSLLEYTELSPASEARLAIEISLLGENNGDEVVLLEANDLDDLRRSHSRYFSDLKDFRSLSK